MDITLIAVLVVLLAGFALVLWFINVKLASLRNDEASSLIKQDMIELNRTVDALRENLQTTMGDKLDKNQALMRDTLTKQLSESAKLIADVTNRLTKLDETNRQVKDVADDLRSLQNILQNPKQRGVLGEYFLQTVLDNVLPPDRYARCCHLSR